MPRELIIPTDCELDSKAFEIMRLWIQGTRVLFTIEVGIWNHPESWGIVCADIMRWVADTQSQATGEGAKAILARLREHFEAELASPTNNPTEGKRVRMQ